MANYKEIMFNYNQIDERIKEMNSLSDELANITLDINFSTSKGESFDKMIQLASKLNEVRLSMAQISSDTAVSLNSMKGMFGSLESSLAGSYSLMASVNGEDR